MKQPERLIFSDAQSGGYGRLLIQTAVFLFTALAYYTWTWSHELAAYGGDNAFYYLTARHFSPWTGPHEIAAYFASVSQYPPLYPLVLALFGGGESILMAHLVTTTILLLAMFLVYRWVVEEGCPWQASLLFSVLVAMLPGTYMQALSIHSEGLYLFTCIAAILLVNRNKAGDGALLLASIMVGLATLTRGAGISLLLAFIVYLFINSRNRKILYSIVALLPQLLWSLFHEKKADSYLSLLTEFYGGSDTAVIASQLKVQFLSFFNAWHYSFSDSQSGLFLVSLLGILCLSCTLLRLYWRCIDGIYVVLYLAMILSWPYPAEMQRLLFPVIPILLAQLFIVVNRFSFPLGNGRKTAVLLSLVAVTIILTVLPGLVLTIERFTTPVDKQLQPYRRTSGWYIPRPAYAEGAITVNHVMKTSLQRAQQLVPGDACLYSIKPSIIGLYANRVSREPPIEAVSDADFRAAMENRDCDYFYMISHSSPTYRSPFYPWERLQEQLQIIEVYGSKNIQGQPVAMLARWKD